MAKLTPDPQLDQLVRELNGSASDLPQRRGSWPAANLGDDHPLEPLLIEMTQRGASDLLLLAGTPPIARIGGRLTRLDGQPLESEDIESLVGQFATDRIRD